MSAPTYHEAADALLARGKKVSDTLRRLDDADAWIEHLSWTAGELGAHMVSVPAIYRRVVLDPSSFEIPDNMADFGQRELEAVGTFDPIELADRLEANVDELIAALAPLTDPVQFYTTLMPRHGVLGVALNELSMHHRDLALSVGEPFDMSGRDVAITMHGMMPASEVFCDHDVALRCPGTYEIGLRGGDHWTISVADGFVTVTPGRPDSAAVRIVGDPLAMVLTSFGRLHPVKAFLTGKVLVWGRQPWKLWWLQQLFVEELSRNGRPRT